MTGNILVTGADGFIGARLCQTLRHNGAGVCAAVRDAKHPAQTVRSVSSDKIRYCSSGSIGPETEWGNMLDNVDVVVHLAAMNSNNAQHRAENLELFRRVNVSATKNLARQSASAGVRRLIFLSSVKVNGECSSTSDEISRCFSELDPPAPADPYAISKWEAEQALGEIAQETGLDVVIIRPPLVYGPGVSGNFLKLMKIVRSGMWLPLNGLDNRRSMIYLDNLVDFIQCCITHPAAAGGLFFVSDMHDISTSELLRTLSMLMHKSPHLFSMPQCLIRAAGHISGKQGITDRLLNSLRVDTSRASSVLGWTPPVMMEKGLEKTVNWFSSTFTQGTVPEHPWQRE